MNRKTKFFLFAFGIAVLLSALVFLIFTGVGMPKEAAFEEKLASDSGEIETVAEDSMTGFAIEEGYVSIYYVEGNQIKSEEQYMLFRGEDVFEAWKQKNGLGEEVKLLDSSIEDNGEESTYEFQGQSIVSYKVGDYFIYNMVISAEIENYYDIIDQELLLTSLEQTFRGYGIIDYDEFNIVVE